MNKKIGYCITCCTMVFAMGTIGFMATASAYVIGSIEVPAGKDGTACAASVDGTTCGPNETVKCQDPEKSGVKYTFTNCDGETNTHYVYDGPTGATGAQGEPGCGLTVTTASRTLTDGSGRTATIATFKDCSGNTIDEFTVENGLDGQGVCDNAAENATKNTIRVYTAGTPNTRGYMTNTETKCNGTQAISKQFDSCFPVADTRTSNQCTGTYLQCANPTNDSKYYVCEQPDTSDNVTSLTSLIQDNAASINVLTNSKVDETAFAEYKVKVDADIATAAAAAAAGMDSDEVNAMINDAVNKAGFAGSIASNTEAISALQNKVTTVETDITALQTSKADKTALDDYVPTSVLGNYATKDEVVDATLCKGTLFTSVEDRDGTREVSIFCDDGEN